LYTYSFCTRWFLKSAVTCWCHSLGPLVPSGILSTAKYTGTIFNHVSPVRFNIWTFDFMVNVRPVNSHQQKKLGKFNIFSIPWPRLSLACFKGKQTGQSLLLQFFQCEIICLDDAQWATKKRNIYTIKF
jgi:hypothetical protein